MKEIPFSEYLFGRIAEDLEGLVDGYGSSEIDLFGPTMLALSGQLVEAIPKLARNFVQWEIGRTVILDRIAGQLGYTHNELFAFISADNLHQSGAHDGLAADTALLHQLAVKSAETGDIHPFFKNFDVHPLTENHTPKGAISLFFEVMDAAKKLPQALVTSYADDVGFSVAGKNRLLKGDEQTRRTYQQMVSGLDASLVPKNTAAASIYDFVTQVDDLLDSLPDLSRKAGITDILPQAGEDYLAGLPQKIRSRVYMADLGWEDYAAMGFRGWLAYLEEAWGGDVHERLNHLADMEEMDAVLEAIRQIDSLVLAQRAHVSELMSQVEEVRQSGAVVFASSRTVPGVVSVDIHVDTLNVQGADQPIETAAAVADSLGDLLRDDLVNAAAEGVY